MKSPIPPAFLPTLLELPKSTTNTKPKESQFKTYSIKHPTTFTISTNSTHLSKKLLSPNKNNFKHYKKSDKDIKMTSFKYPYFYSENATITTQE